MKITRKVDPRDCAWEERSASYRVDVWKQAASSENAPAHFEVETIEIADAPDVFACKRWAEAELDISVRDCVVISVVARCPDGVLGLIRVAGREPDGSTPNDPTESGRPGPSRTPTRS